MIRSKGKFWKFFFLPLMTLLFGAVVAGCSDDDDELGQSQYGYVQFKLYKTASYVETGTEEGTESAKLSRADMDKLGEAKKIEIEMQFEGTSITQTLVLNSYSESNAEYGVRSDKLQLMVGDYRIVGYRLLDGLDQVLTGISADPDEAFTVVPGGLTVKDLTVDAQERGMVKFKLVKDGLSRAGGEYLFSSIALIDVTVTNTFTQQTTTFHKLKVTYEEDYEESASEDDPDDKYKNIATAKCDSAVWLEAGTYRVSSYTTYSKTGARESELETQSVSGENFTVADNALTDDAIVPIQLSETAEYIKDYKALREIWESLNGPNWSYFGQEYSEGTNWNFNKELDMWGDQPGVTLNSEGRVVGLALSNFGISGRVPDAIGQLTELQILALGSHDEKVGGGLFGKQGITPDMSEDRKLKMRRNYEELYLKTDIRSGLSEMLQEVINNNPSKTRIAKKDRPTLKDTQIGVVTNGLTFISKAVMRLTKLQQFYIANAPIECDKGVAGGENVDNFCAEWEDPNSSYAQEYEEEPLSWANMKDLTDIEVYNCKNIKTLPAFLYQLPEIQLLNIACNTGISAEQLKADWTELAKSPVTGPKIQILYMGYNNLEAFPGHEDGPNADVLKNMKKLGLLDLTDNNVEHLMPFGTDIKLVTLYLQNNQITEVPDDFCGFTNDVESFNFSNNQIKYIPNIFDAKSMYVMGSLDFSNNLIGSDADDNNHDGIKDDVEDSFKGINASEVSLANNRIENFPASLFKAGSPITVLNMSGNLLSKINVESLWRTDNEIGKQWCPLETFDLRFNRLTELEGENYNAQLPYLQGIDLSYNCFSKFPTNPLNVNRLMALAIRHQRDADGNRCLREWPEGLTSPGSCPNLYWFQIGSNDIRKVEEQMTTKIYILDIADNPNITIDLTNVCSAISAGAYLLYYDKTQDIRGCDILLE